MTTVEQKMEKIAVWTPNLFASGSTSYAGGVKALKELAKVLEDQEN